MPQLDYLGRDRAQFQTVNDEPSVTVRSERDTTDINFILSRYRETGVTVDQLADASLIFADVSEFTDYADMMRNLKLAEGEFLKLDPQVRRIFDNKVENWLDASHDEEKQRALVEGGFVEDTTGRFASGGAPAQPTEETVSNGSGPEVSTSETPSE